jgi:hypothetical protein
VILGRSMILPEPSESESPPSFDITSDSSVLSLSSSTLFLFDPALPLPLGLAGILPFAPLAGVVPALASFSASFGVPAGLALALTPPAEPPAFAPDPLLFAFPTGVLGISMFMEVFMPINTLRLMSSYPGVFVPAMPIEERPVAPAPELMRLRIISVAAENWGTYLGGEGSVMVVSVVLACPVGVLAAGLELDAMVMELCEVRAVELRFAPELIETFAEIERDLFADELVELAWQP